MVLFDIIYHGKDKEYRTKALANGDETIAVFQLPFFYMDEMRIESKEHEIVTFKHVPSKQISFRLDGTVVISDNGKEWKTRQDRLKNAMILVTILGGTIYTWRKELRDDNIWFYVPDRECYPILVTFMGYYTLIAPLCDKVKGGGNA